MSFFFNLKSYVFFLKKKFILIHCAPPPFKWWFIFLGHLFTSTFLIDLNQTESIIEAIAMLNNIITISKETLFCISFYWQKGTRPEKKEEITISKNLPLTVFCINCTGNEYYNFVRIVLKYYETTPNIFCTILYFIPIKVDLIYSCQLPSDHIFLSHLNVRLIQLLEQLDFS